jgi:hypothetical protein
MNLKWTVMMSRQATKQLGRLPLAVRKSLIALMREIEIAGPVRGNWPKYGPLRKGRHHCHLKKGRPTYVAVWEVVDKAIKVVEVTYAGTHERAPY